MSAKGEAIERMVPLYEAKMFHHYDHRWATYQPDGETREVIAQEKEDPRVVALPRYWLRETVVLDVADGWPRWLLAFRDICRSTDERTAIASELPFAAVGHTAPLIRSIQTPKAVACLAASVASFVFDFVTRQKVGGTHLTYGYFQQLPTLRPSTFESTCQWQPGRSTADWVVARVLELTYTAWDLAAFALDVGYEGAPFRWNPERRALLRAELDAAFFHLYGLSRDDADYVMDTFPIVKRKDEAAHGDYCTKRRILEAYDAIAEAIRTGTPYQTRLDPPPAARVAGDSR
jgi:hypothetical protein